MSLGLEGKAKALVLDANILIRAVLGRRVHVLLETYASHVHFLTPEVAYQEIRTHLPEILTRRGLAPTTARTLLEQGILSRLPLLVVPILHEVYAEREQEARKRLVGRDEADWPYLALALQLGCPIWTEDTDFFGSGVATWTTDRITLYLEA
ncbi:MAG: PIN domain-containing protein [Chloroflexi bacterium]|nr:PIN domain-containing protein [Chloroflexota bacterium]